MTSRPLAVVYAQAERAAHLCSVLPRPWITVVSSGEVLEVARMHRVIVFCDLEKLGELGDLGLTTPIVAIVDQPIASRSVLSVMIERFELTPWLSHAITLSLLVSPLAESHLFSILQGSVPSLASPTPINGVGRLALLATASKRATRIERMHDFFERQGIPDRTLAALDQVAEELVMNALYNAPAEAGYFDRPVSRSEDVDLAPERACEISYGIERECAFVRVRDSFGSLSRSRLSKVLGRCNRGGALDESRGGLGLWRILSAASTVAITVVPNKLTDIVVRIIPSESGKPRVLAGLDLSFPSAPSQVRAHAPYDIDDLEDDSVTLLRFD